MKNFDAQALYQKLGFGLIEQTNPHGILEYPREDKLRCIKGENIEMTSKISNISENFQKNLEFYR